ncbi:thiopeptide-type bacteriocin biosynthesis protein [Nonomuraea sp. CA-143628]|uniref:thiopeptide-type bacteriocin biosynthesis protein n=1 Tax=Nonomuraea sp. CA-143628 TaxID=3239997 RepID=UPI003D92B0F9
MPTSRLADAVLAVLTDTPVEVAAAALNMRVEDLADAVESYQTAGYRALEDRVADHGWYHLRLHFPDWETAEQAAATALGPSLDHLHDIGLINAWWFIRKHPAWRLRLRPAGGVTPEVRSAIHAVLNDLAVSWVISRWRPGMYEPENASFGGAVGTEIAHDLFHADSHHMLHYLRQPTHEVGRREVSMLLCSTLLSAARLDRFERGDLWSRVAELRPLPADTPPGRLEAMADTIRPLVSAPIGSADPEGLCAFAAPWTEAFRHTGQLLSEAATAGHLDRGVRHVLTHLVIFHWNRLGLSATTQAILSRAARDALLPRN